MVRGPTHFNDENSWECTCTSQCCGLIHTVTQSLMVNLDFKSPIVKMAYVSTGLDYDSCYMGIVLVALCDWLEKYIF